MTVESVRAFMAAHAPEIEIIELADSTATVVPASGQRATPTIGDADGVAGAAPSADAAAPSGARRSRSWLR